MMRMIKTALGMGAALGLGLLLSVPAADARGGMGGGGGFGGGGGGFHGGFGGGGGMAFFPHRMGGFGGGGFAMHGNPGFRRFGMAMPGRQFGPMGMGWRHANFHNFHDGRFRHFHRNFVGFPFFVGGGFPYDDYGYYDYGGYYGGDCSIAYRNARATGSSYWWNRYSACVGYGY